MAEYLPIFKPGSGHHPRRVGHHHWWSGSLRSTGSGTVGPAGAASVKVVGVAAFDAVSTDNVTIFAGGVQHAVASGAITAGAVVQAGAAGTVAAGTTAPIGIALTTAADGADVRVQMAR